MFNSLRQRYKSFVRYNQILRVFMRYGFEDLVSYMIEADRFSFIRKIIPQTTRKNAKKYTKWERMRLVCEELGPTFVKFGQILSNRPDLLPEDLIFQFERLQDNVPPVPGDVARKVVEEELKGSVDELFAFFEKDAFASASMAQVHRVTLKTGERVALKVQRPGIKDTIQEDIHVMYRLAETFQKRIPSLKSFDMIGLVRNFEESILKELDFIHESINIQRFAKNINEDKSDKTTHTLKVYREFTTAKVLAMGFVKGIKISDTSTLRAKGFDPELIGKKLAVSYLKQVFEYGFFHADPHAGNILVLADGELCFLDFGLMGSILDRDIEIFGGLFIAVKEKDVNGIIRSLMNMSEVSVVEDMRALEFAINEFIEKTAVISTNQNEMSNVLMELKDVVVVHGLKVPSHFFLLARSLVTIEGLIHHLNPELDLLELSRPFLIKAITKKFNPLKTVRKVLTGLRDLGDYMEEFPHDLKNAIHKINKGKVQVDMTHRGIDPMVHTLNRITKHIVTAMIIAGLFIASTMFIIDKVEPLWNGTSAFGIIGMIFAIVLAYGLLNDLRKGDHDNWKGWEE